MSFLNRKNDWKTEFLNQDDSSIFGRNRSYEERKEKLDRAKRLVSNDGNGMFERDEEVWHIADELIKNGWNE